MSRENITDVVVASNKSSDGACTEGAAKDCERGECEKVEEL
jgi:hypothetical protein